jgi:hypothetical protein
MTWEPWSGITTIFPRHCRTYYGCLRTVSIGILWLRLPCSTRGREQGGALSSRNLNAPSADEIGERFLWIDGLKIYPDRFLHVGFQRWQIRSLGITARHFYCFSYEPVAFRVPFYHYSKRSFHAFTPSIVYSFPFLNHRSKIKDRENTLPLKTKRHSF